MVGYGWCHVSKFDWALFESIHHHCFVTLESAPSSQPTPRRWRWMIIRITTAKMVRKMKRRNSRWTSAKISACDGVCH